MQGWSDWEDWDLLQHRGGRSHLSHFQKLCHLQDVMIQGTPQHLAYCLQGCMQVSKTPKPMKMPMRQRTLYELGCRLVQGPRCSPDPRGDSDKLATGTDTFHKKSPTASKFNILQINVDGIQPKKVELAKLLHARNIHIALIQETMLPLKSEFHITGYTPNACKCKKCQGIITLVRNDITAEVSIIETNDEVDLQQVVVQNDGTTFRLYNVYNPPRSTFNSNNLPLDPTSHKIIVAGDFNGHSPTWGYDSRDKSGQAVEDLINSTSLILLQSPQSTPTLLHRATGLTSRPDLTMVSADIYPSCTMSILDGIGSDHRPILIEVDIPTSKKDKRNRPLKWNYKKANWELYRAKVKENLDGMKMEDDLDSTYKQIADAIIKSAKEAIPRGNRKKYQPYWNPELENLTKERKKARRKAEKHPSAQNRKHYNYLTAKVKLKSKESRRTTWREYCGKLDLRKDGKKAWTLLNNLSGKRRKTNPKPLKTPSGEISNVNKAKAFNKFFAHVNKSKPRKPLDKAIKNLTKKLERSPKANCEVFEKEFSLSELKYAIKKCHKGKSPGPDSITNEMLTNLQDPELIVVLQFINRTWIEGKLPLAWKKAIIMPILKKGKPASELKSYRPISLTSCLGKVAERMINERLYWWLEHTKTIHTSQAGFRKGKRTIDQLIRFAQNTCDAYQNKESTLACFIDLRQAYDRVWRQGLLFKMQKLGIAGPLYNWIKNFLSCRTISTSHNHQISKQVTLEEGLPQGSALSCTLFLIFINDLPSSITCNKALFADDLLIWHTSKNQREMTKSINRNLANIYTFCQLWKLEINTEKTTYTVFTLSRKRKNFEVRLNGENLKHDDYPRYLGVELDRTLSLNRHIGNVHQKASQRLNLMKLLASSTWGSDMNTLRQIYIGYVRSIIDYSLPLQCVASKSSLAKFDILQNQALRFVSGALRTTPANACEIHTNIEPLNLRRERAICETYERYTRMNPVEENRKMVDDHKERNRIKKTSFITEAKKICTNQNLPTERKPLQSIKLDSPCSMPRIPAVRTELLDSSVRKNDAPTILKAATLETIYNHDQEAIHVYTDGSACKATTNAGYGAIIKYPQTHPEDHREIFGACGAYCSNYHAEIKAIDASLRQILNDFESNHAPPENIIIFSDSKSALQAIELANSSDTQSISRLLHQILDQYAIEITLQWIPGHCGIPGNEKADRLAKTGASMPQADFSADYLTCKQILKNNSKEDWLNRWATASTGRKLFKHQTKPIPADPAGRLPRRDQAIIFRARTGHLNTNFHRNRINPMHEPHCRHCSHHQESVEHLLLHCPNLSALRNQLLPSSPNIDNTLYTNLEQLKKTSNFVKMVLR